MALGFRKPRQAEPEQKSSSSDLTEEEAKHFQALLAQAKAGSFAPDEWSFIVDSFEKLEEAGFVTKELALSNIPDEFEKNLIWAYKRLLDYVTFTLPKEDKLKRAYASKFYGRLWLNVSDKALGRILLKTARAELKKETVEAPREKKQI